MPVGEDQAPLVEQTNEIVRRINATADRDVLPEARAVIPSSGRLPGIDGEAKMSKSGGNAIPLFASSDMISAAVRAMFTDPSHLRVEDPGRVEGNVIFTYLDAFDEDHTELEEMKAHYRRGGLGDSKIKRHLEDILQALLAPIRQRRAELAAEPAYVWGIIRNGTAKARERTETTRHEVI